MFVGSNAKMSKAPFEIFILLLLSITVAGQNNLPQRDVCGTLNTEYYYSQKSLTEIGEFPWMGRVYYKKKTSAEYVFKCYAILISKFYVLLNPECFSSKDLIPASVILGDWYKGNDYKKSDCDDRGRCAPVPKEHQIEEILIHPNYSSESEKNNIAMVRLSEPGRYSDFIRPICLPSKDIVHMNFNNQILEETGWYYNLSLGLTLAKSYARVINLNTCELRLTQTYAVDKQNSLCAFSCWDNHSYIHGSALMGTIVEGEEPVNYYLIGIKVFGNQCRFNKPYVYSRIDRYLDWIYEETNKEVSLIGPRK